MALSYALSLAEKLAEIEALYEADSLALCEIEAEVDALALS